MNIASIYLSDLISVRYREYYQHTYKRMRYLFSAMNE